MFCPFGCQPGKGGARDLPPWLNRIWWAVFVFSWIVTFLAAMGMLAGAAEPAIATLPNLAYKPGDAVSEYEQARCKLDLYFPKGGKDLPCLVWFHGGGLTAGSKDGPKTAATCRALAAEGILVASVNYRLSPKARYPAYVEDAAASVAWLLAHGGEHGGNTRRFFVSGHSAGGYLAAMIGSDDRYLQKHGVLLSSLAGIIPLAGQMMTHYTVRQERGLPKERIIADEAAPIHHAGKTTPPWLILHAEHDMALRADENRYFAAALTAAGHPDVTLREIPGHDHTGLGDRIPEPGSPVRSAMVEFIRAH